MSTNSEGRLRISRRSFLRKSLLGTGALALSPLPFHRYAATEPITLTVSPQITWSDARLPKIAQHMFSLMLRNLASDGFLFVDPNHPDPHDPQSFSLPGCIIAAPSSPFNTPGLDQDYVYNWTRDAAIAAMEIAAAKMPTAPDSGVQQLIDYVNFAQTCQNNATPSFALASYTIRGLSREWTEQTDGPPLQTLAILMAYDQLDTPSQAVAKAVINKNLDYLLGAYQDQTFNLWEEHKGFSFFARSVQLRCLQAIKANALASRCRRQRMPRSRGYRRHCSNIGMAPSMCRSCPSLVVTTRIATLSRHAFMGPCRVMTPSCLRPQRRFGINGRIPIRPTTIRSMSLTKTTRGLGLCWDAIRETLTMAM